MANGKRKARDRDSNPYADLESFTRDASNGKKSLPRFNTRVRITVVHRRYRLVDPDGLSIKAALDGLVKAKILADDSAKEIEEIRHRQEQIHKPELETTTFIIEPVECELWPRK